MSKSLLTISLIALALVSGSCARHEARSIVILYENDVHCSIDGYSRMKGLAQEISDTACVGLVSCGDYLHGGTAGAISSGSHVVDIMKEMDYDAVGLGNHEFDFHVQQLLKLVADASLPVVNANFCTVDTDSLFFAPYVVRNYGARSIGYVGVVTPETLLSEAYAFYDDQGEAMYSLSQGKILDKVQRSVDEVLAKGVDFVVLLSHLGETSAKNLLTSHQLVSQTRGIDVVLDAHTHSVVPCDTVLNMDGKPVLVTQTGSRFKNVGKLLVTKDGKISTQLIPLDSIKAEDTRVRQVTDSIKEEMSKVTSRFVGHSDYNLTIYNADGRQQVRFAETNAGNLVADAFRAVTGAELAVNNGGGIRAQLPSGDWTYGDIVNMLPYQNYLQVVELKGAKLLELLYATTATSPMEDGQFPQISGFRFKLNTKKTGADRISDVEVFNEETRDYEPLSLSRTYTLCTTDYCVTGGGMYGVLRNEKVLSDNMMLYYEAVIEFVSGNLKGEIPECYAGTQGRIVLK